MSIKLEASHVGTLWDEFKCKRSAVELQQKSSIVAANALKAVAASGRWFELGGATRARGGL